MSESSESWVRPEGAVEAWGSPGTRGRPGETTCGVLLGQARELRQSHRSIQNLQAEGLVEEFGTCSQATLKKKKSYFVTRLSPC